MTGRQNTVHPPVWLGRRKQLVKQIYEVPGIVLLPIQTPADDDQDEQSRGYHTIMLCLPPSINFRIE